MVLKYLLLKSTSISAAVLLSILVLCSCGLFYFDAGKNNKMPDSNLPASELSNSHSGSLSNSEDSTQVNDKSEEIEKTQQDVNDNGSGDKVADNKDENKYTGELEEGEMGFFKVSEVIDGDTFKIENSEKIRLIGINTPEIDMFFYEEAREVLKIIAEGKSVSLEKDVSERDRYGRLLRYAFYCDLFINLEMLQRGFANVYTMPPDVKYQQVFIEAERYARENNLGLWERSPYSFKISAQEQQESAISIEINWDAKGDDKKNMNDEYVIFINNTGNDISLEGWTVKDSGTNIYKFKKYNFKNGSEIILYTGSGSDGNNKFYWNSDMPVWNNSGDTFYLRDRDGLLAQIFNY